MNTFLNEVYLENFRNKIFLRKFFDNPERLTTEKQVSSFAELLKTFFKS